jgi:hypothetical protein
LPKVLDQQTLEYGAMLVYSKTNPTKASTAQYAYTFSGWTPAIVAVAADATYNQTTRSYTVTFLVDGAVYDTQTVACGGAATAPTSNPTKDGYTFTGWDKAFDNITSNLEVNAMWTENMIDDPVFKSAKVKSFNTNLQDKNNDNLRFVVTVTMSDGSTYDAMSFS